MFRVLGFRVQGLGSSKLSLSKISNSQAARLFCDFWVMNVFEVFTTDKAGV